MGNNNYQRVSITNSIRTHESLIEPFEILTPREESEILSQLTFFDRRYDYRFGKATLFKNSSDSILAKIKHKFSDFELLKAYSAKYAEREKVRNTHLMKITFLYNTKIEDARTDNYIINLIIEYPYNDLKNEINFRIVNSKRFTEAELLKFLKTGVGALNALKSAGYCYPFELTQYSFCIFDKPNGKKTFRVLEFSIFDKDPIFKDKNALQNLYERNCYYLAILVLEASNLINKNLNEENCDKSVVLRYLDQFLIEYKNNTKLCTIVDAFIHNTKSFKLEQAHKVLFVSEKNVNGRYIYDDNQIIVNTGNHRKTQFDVEKIKSKINK